MKKLIEQFSLRPERLFLLDGTGALLTAALLFFLLKPFNEFIGMPGQVLSWLSLIALFFAFYSISCALLLKGNWRPFLRIIMIANILYCCLTGGLVIYFFSELTLLGIAYFLSEIAIICSLVFLEAGVLKAAPVKS
ncbi:MAG TPA: hypothetical protein VFR58_06845 [Flavisolibacter sp.]|nr:hypothetical protein [Flavisolibacter sp.]